LASTLSEPHSRGFDAVSESIRLILASASPARLRTLRAAGLDPDVVVSGIDEGELMVKSGPELVAELARKKATAVSEQLDHLRRPAVIVGCDSMLELDGQAHGKPATAAQAVKRWRMMSGRSAMLLTGHHVIMRRAGETLTRSAVAATTVHFAELTDGEIEAYVATGEPMQVAGAFTIDGLGGAYVTGIEGDHHNVVGISLPLLRMMVAELGISWPSLWR
jgi:septum formation protein